ncbi:MAG: 1-deoxy-D-xylulose-5-phosphate reductoisomerase [Pseudomonadota bacterium]
MRSVSVLGITGSIGQSTQEVLARHSENYEVNALTAHQNVDLLIEYAHYLKAKKVVIGHERHYEHLKESLSGTGIEVAAGREAILEAAAEPVDWTMCAITGMTGLEPLLKAIDRGGKIAIANKEPLVAAGELVMKRAQESGATLLPVDSEHNAIFQVFEAQNREAITKLIITGSGGPFRTWSAEQIAKASIEDALNHPNWSMGQKITIDSATLMNKALEVIEAHYLFDIPQERIKVLIHPQSIIHSMVEYVDGSVLAQMGAPDMRTPITQSLAWPERMETPGETLDMKSLSDLTFEQVDYERFPAMSLAYQALEKGQSACLVMNAANEIAVQAFLNNKISFTDIVSLAQDALDNHTAMPLNSLEEILEFDHDVRAKTERAILDINKNQKAA